MASLHSLCEIVPIELPNPEETQIWENENKSVCSHQDLILQLLLIIAIFIWQARIGCHGNGLIDIGKKTQNPVFDNAGCVFS